MKDFTKKGTKLPVIPVGTKFKWLNKGFFTEPCKSNKKGTCKELNFISGGTYQNDNIIYVICDDQSTVKLGMEYLIKLSTIERLAKEQGMYNTNNENMNQKVTLQENGTVTVTDTETTTTLSKTTVDEICRLVKEDGEKAKLEVGKWYHYIGGLYVWNNGNTTYGFNSQKRFNDHYYFSTSNGAVEATPETVQQYLKAEAVKRGYKKGCRVNSVTTINDSKDLNCLINSDEFDFTGSSNNTIIQMTTDESDWTNNYSNPIIFDNGVWATILKPETITRAEAEKRYDVKITD